MQLKICLDPTQAAATMLNSAQASVHINPAAITPSFALDHTLNAYLRQREAELDLYQPFMQSIFRKVSVDQLLGEISATSDGALHDMKDQLPALYDYLRRALNGRQPDLVIKLFKQTFFHQARSRTAARNHRCPGIDRDSRRALRPQENAFWLAWQDPAIAKW